PPMRLPMRTTPFRAVLALLIALFALGSIADAGGIVFKDGYVLKGRVKREGDTVFDPASGQMVPVGKGFFMVDDGVRHVIFSIRQVQDVIDNDGVEGGADPVVLSRPFTRMFNGELRWIDDLQEVKAFDENWDREVRLVPHTGKSEIARQRLIVLTPYLAR